MSKAMAFDVILPDLGDGIESGDVLEIYVSVGQTVAKEQGLIELETDKATVTVPSPRAGKISKILIAPGQSVPVGSVIVQLEMEGAEVPGAAKTPPTPQATTSQSPAAASTQTASPGPGPAANSASQDRLPVGQNSSASPSATGSSPTTSADHISPTPQPSTGMNPVPSHAPPARTNVSVSMSVNPAQANQPGTTGSISASSPAEADQQSASGSALVAASPAVRRFAREVGVDLSVVPGSGDGGRITRDDILRAVREASSRAASAQQSGFTPHNSPSQKVSKEPQPGLEGALPGSATKSLPGTPGTSDYGPVRLEKLSKIRKTIAAQMHKSWTTAPQVTNFDDADVTELEAIRVSSKDDYSARGIKLTSMPFLLKAVATALRNHPLMNAVLDLDNEQIIYNDYVNLGVAVDTPRGLVVPNIRNTHLMSIPDIAKALAELANRVRNGEFSVGELRGGTFTISNLGAIGGTYSTPIINVPEAAILLVGRTRKLPVVMSDDSIKVRQMMPLSLTYDHRLIDGGTAARFLNEVIALLENPSRLLLAIS